MKHIIIIILIFLHFGSFSQEIVTYPGQSNNISLKQIKKTKLLDTLNLPFFDDFSDSSKYSKHFEDNFVSVDYTQAILPPSIGTVCFDAIDNNQNFYYSYSRSGIADYLTTKPINLFFPGDNSIFLSFYIQAKGLMEKPEVQDSLVLQFYAPLLDKWNTVWSKSNDGDISFKQIILKISDDIYLQKGFKFRFYNRVSMPSNQYPSYVSDCDYWFVDYIYLNKNRSIVDTIRKDIAFQNIVKFKFDDYQKIPYNHYKSEYLSINHNFYINFRNNENKARTIDSMYFVFHDKQNVLSNDTLFLGSYNFAGFDDFHLERQNVNFSFPIISDDYLNLILETKLKTDTYDSTCNNVIKQEKQISVTYAYDDGTAENGYGLYGDGTLYAYVAQKYYTYKDYYMTGMQVYFNKTLNNVQPYYFYAVVWENNDKKGVPAEIVYEQEGFDVNHNRLNNFQTYKFSEPVLVTDTFYVGWKKTVEEIMNVGIDINSTVNNYKFYNINGTWKESSADGVLMIRPIFGDVSLANNDEQKSEEILFNIYPNPVENILSYQIEQSLSKSIDIRIIDLNGRISKSQHSNSDYGTIDVSSLSQGFYIFEIIDQNKVYRKKFIKR